MSDKEISAMSYTSKDFGTLYSDTLDLAKQLTTKWDPSHSNESDPGVVLIKEGAFIADHNNYNIDKNVLENFLPSATQDRSVRNITEMNGYTPRYYVSAMGKVSFKWENPNAVSGDASSVSFTIPKFTLTVSDADGTITYTQVEDLSISIDTNNPSAASVVSSCNFMEGTKQTLKVNNSDTVLLENLDDNNRIYLPETRVAQNGIFIRYKNADEHKEYGYWERNNYLLTQPTGSRMYKIDYDSNKNLPYIEFPSDISNIILSGLIIEYISTSGEAGNVSANTLVNIVSPAEFYDSDNLDTSKTDRFSRSCEYLTLNNVSAITNGKDPETISEMYKSFKKVVGTFDTLVSCNDYSNRIYEIDNNGTEVVSNCYVTDRRTDYNKALNVVCFDEKGAYLKNISTKKSALVMRTDYKDNGHELITVSDISGAMYYCLNDWEDDPKSYPKGLYVNVSPTGEGVDWQHCDYVNLNDFAVLTEAMTPYDLVIYGLKTFSMADYNKQFPYRALNNSFMPIDSDTRDDIQDSELGYLSESKCICHTFKNPSNGEVYCFKNYVPLSVTIVPYNKITEDDQESILNKVYIEISKKFNPRNINFGEGLDISELKSVIINSDDRIKDCNIDYKYVTYGMNSVKNDSGVYEEKKLTENFSGNNTFLLLDLVTKNILSGRVCMFEFDEDFTYDYEQSACEFVNNVSSIITELPIELTPSSEKNVQTSKTTQTVYTIDGSKNTISYNFMAPNFVTNEGVLKNVGSNTSYTLQISDDGKKIDTFKIQSIDKSGNTTETVYTGGNDVTYSISLNDADIKNTNKKKEFTSVSGIITITEIKIDASDESGDINLEYQLDENEYIQVIYPNYYSENSYGLYVSYRYMAPSGSIIRANSEHTLGADEKIVLIYTQDGVTKQDILNTGTIVKSSFDIENTDSLTSKGVKKSWTDDNGIYHENDVFRTLASNQTIDTRILLETLFTSTNQRCYWITNSTISDGKLENRLFPIGQREKVLGNNEYFIYTNATMDEMMILGAGTKLIRNEETLDETRWVISQDLTLTIESVTENGITSSLPWRKMDFSQNNLEIIEMNVVTLSEGDIIKITGWDELEYNSEGSEYINNEWKKCNGSIVYTIDGNTVILPKIKDFYEIRSRLDLMCGPQTYQNLIYKTDSEGKAIAIQKIFINGSSEPITSKDHNYRIQSSQNLNLIGGEVIDLSYYTENGIDINMYFYAVDETWMTGKVVAGSGPETVEKDLGGSRSINVDIEKTLPKPQKYTYTYPFFYKNNPLNWNREYLVPIYINGNEVSITAKMYKIEGSTKTQQTFTDYNTGQVLYETMTLTGNSMYFLTPVVSIGTEEKPQIKPLESNGCELIVELSWEFDSTKERMLNVETIIIDDLRVIKGINQKLSIYDGVDGRLSIITKENLLNRINSIIKDSDKPNTKFYYSYKPDASLEINLDKYLDYNISYDESTSKKVITYNMKAFDNPLVMWDPNNIANKMSIAQVDLANSNIKIDNSMVV